jgi:hypothetical protein
MTTYHITPATEDWLHSIHAPRVVGVPPTNAIRELMILPDGEIRHYGFDATNFSAWPHNIYLSSRDYGRSWQTVDSPPFSPGATVRSPWSGDYLTLAFMHGKPGLEDFHSIGQRCTEPGFYIHRSSNGPDGPFISKKICDPLPRMLTARQPVALKHRKRWVLAAHALVNHPKRQSAVVFLSDDDGDQWKMVALPAIEGPGVVWPHKGFRWENCGAEPTVVELLDGRLHMLIRTSHDQFWESFSSDGGDTWSNPTPSRFYGTITTPLLFRLSDSRLMVFLNQTTPLPELDHSTQNGLSQAELDGEWEDFFTNRDALHAAISEDDGRSWTGFREIHLNERRNDADFRSRGGNATSNDKSVHQCQAVELPTGKVLLSFGQHHECRRMVVFSPEWLYEKHRMDEFRHGLKDWSIHQYYKSVAGGFRGFSGHCALNRRAGPAMIPHPDGLMREVLQIARHRDDRLMDDREGAVWNFPASLSGQLTLKVYQPSGSQGVQISLVDRWFNPVDPVVASFSQLVLRIDKDGSLNGQTTWTLDCWHELSIRWNINSNSPQAGFRIDDSPEYPLTLSYPTEFGINYVHLQTLAESEDLNGIYLEKVDFSSQ